MDIRIVQVCDTSFINVVRKQCEDSTYPHHVLTMPVDEGDLQLNTGRGVAFVAMALDCPVGYLSLMAGDGIRLNDALCADMTTFVVPTYRGKGIGRKVTAHVEGWIGANTSVVILSAGGQIENTGARRRLERLGFSESDRPKAPGAWLVEKALRRD